MLNLDEPVLPDVFKDNVISPIEIEPSRILLPRPILHLTFKDHIIEPSTLNRRHV